MESSESIRITVGDGEVSAAYARPAGAVATLVLAPGAGSSFDHPFLVGFTGALNEAGVATLRFNFPYREAGRRLPDRAPAAMAAWRAVMAAVTQLSPAGPVWVGGKSFGGRMASLAVADGMKAAGLVFLGYPLHPPGKPEKLRDEHLYGIERPMQFVQGTRDPFARPELLTAVVDRIGAPATLYWVEEANHSFEVRGARRPPDAVGAALAPVVAGLLHAGTPPAGSGPAGSPAG